MTYYVHVNRGVIDANRKRGENAPPVRVQRGRYGKSAYAHEVELPPGSKIVYDHLGTILPCGARLVIACPTAPKIVR